MLMKEIKDLNGETDILCSWTRRLSIVMMSIFPKLIHRLNAIPVMVPVTFIVNINKISFKFIWKANGLKFKKIISRNNHLPDLKT